MEYTFDPQGMPKMKPKRMDAVYVASKLQVSKDEANNIVRGLTEEGWLKPDKLVPTTRGMALAQHQNRPRITRREADEIVEQTIEWAKRVNAQDGARVKVLYIDLFGSYITLSGDVGDVDMVVKFNTHDLEDLQPEDMEVEIELLEELRNISEYISPSDELDQLTLDGQKFKRIFADDHD